MEDFIPIFAIFAVFGTITAIIVGPTWLKSKEKREMQATLRHAMDKGQELPADVINALTQDVQRNLPSRTRDIRRGVIWLAIGIGMAAFGYITGGSFGNDWDGNNFDTGMLGLAAIPTTIGLAFIVLSFFNKNKD
ncbi:DUF6249 domain-containing protein [Brevundimonas kwangchunensis]|uniref:DUF6249 domain-containing protein n=1 Tax=Brevundimonas kwangchunensis TaxID=322163 RepID=A0ABP3S3I1_9CAUL